MQIRDTVIPIILILLDYVLVVISFSLAYLLRDQINGVFLVPFGQFIEFVLITGLVYVIIFANLGLYSRDKLSGLVDQLFKIIIGSLSAVTLAGAIIYFARSYDYSRLIIGISFILSVFLIWFGRILIRVIEEYLYRRGYGVTNVVAIGQGPLLDMLIKSYQALQATDYRLTKVFFTSPELRQEINLETEVDKFDLSALEDLITARQVNEVVLADADIEDEVALNVINLCENIGIRFRYVPDLFDVATARVETQDLAGMPLIELKPTILEGWMVLVKRLMDIILSAVGLIVLSPLFAITSALIKLNSKGPVFFRHKRVGQHGKEFELLKFRSMSMIEKDGQLLHASEDRKVEKLKERQPNYKLEDDPRVTSVGRFIRKTSIDELPQLWNVLKGELSLVGPRAYLKKELEKQQSTYPQTRGLVRRLMTVKPGITGLWQVSGRSQIKFTERVSMDAYYATHGNIWLDIKILLQTLPVVIRGSGAM